jgi:hypothetical protein
MADISVPEASRRVVRHNWLADRFRASDSRASCVIDGRMVTATIDIPQGAQRRTVAEVRPAALTHRAVALQCRAFVLA